MSILSLLFGHKPKTAAVAKERLQLIIARERGHSTSTATDYLPALQKELINVISRYVNVNPEDIKVSLEKQDNYEVLEVNIVLPDPNRSDKGGESAEKPAMALADNRKSPLASSHHHKKHLSRRR